MPKTMAELRAEKPNWVPERSVPLCLAQHLVAETMALTSELQALPDPQPPTDEDGRPTGPPRRIGIKPYTEDPRAQEIRDRLAALLEEMAQYDGELRVRAIDDGAWRRWVNEHPARAEGEPGYDRDLVVAGGFCNADDLIETLSAFAYSWNGDVLSAGDWDDILAPNVTGPDKKLIATAVVTMHETRLDFQQWRSSLSTSLLKSSSAGSPAPSESPLDDSSAGNPSSDTTTTTPPES